MKPYKEQIFKVISFCLWGDKPQYTVGAIKNAKLAQELYPDWECWYYVDYDEYDGCQRSSYFEELANVGNTKVFSDSRRSKHHLMLSRFEAIDGVHIPHHIDLVPDVMIVRDCDSRLSLREKLAVDKWLSSDKQFLVMKDHPWHAGVPILGGLWGVKAGLLPNMAQMVNDFIQADPRNEWQCDQRFLTDKIWPQVQHTAMIFDPFYGGLNYPIPREGFNFCGATYNEDDKIPQEQIDLLQRYWKP